MKIFIAGVMQGNKKVHGIRSQNYRATITKHLKGINKNLEIVDPDKTDPDRLNYDNQQAAEMFFRYCRIAGEVDLLISYLPEASMGSAAEMWVAHEHKVPIITISPLAHNWVVKLLSTMIFPDLDIFLRNFDTDTLKKLKVF